MKPVAIFEGYDAATSTPVFKLTGPVPRPGALLFAAPALAFSLQRVIMGEKWVRLSEVEAAFGDGGQCRDEVRRAGKKASSMCIRCGTGKCPTPPVAAICAPGVESRLTKAIINDLAAVAGMFSVRFEDDPQFYCELFARAIETHLQGKL